MVYSAVLLALFIAHIGLRVQDKLCSHQSFKLKDDKNEEMMSAAGKGVKYFYHQSCHCFSFNCLLIVYIVQLYCVFQAEMMK